MQNSNAIASLARPLSVGPVVLANRVFLAPMSGISDRPFRALAAVWGAGMVVSEMVASDQLARGDTGALMRAERTGTGPHVIQLAGREARWMAEGARAATDAGADIIDINMGCPARKVTGGYSGSALMRDLDHAVTLIEATVAATDRPVTLKMRLGWDNDCLNAPELARRAEAAGVSMITVHGRTRCQFYTGAADWAAIRAVRDAITIPLVANGDLASVEVLGQMLEASGADAVMIGRGSYGRPWFPGEVAAFASTGIRPTPPTGRALHDLVLAHYADILSHYGLRVGLRAARKHLGWYLAAAGVGAGLRSAILTGEDTATVARLVSAAFGADRDEAAA